MRNEKVIYTSITGGYDIINQPEVVYEGYDYICFTNDMSPQHLGVWEIRPIPIKMRDNSRLSRYVKILPHKVLNEYDYSCYIDMNIIIRSDLLKIQIEKCIGENKLISIPKHPEGRTCVYQEAKAVLKQNREHFFSVVRQLRFLKKEGYPENNGLFENNIIFRQHNDKSIIRISELWWRIYCKYTHRDQLSLVYVLWKYGVKAYNLLPDGITTYTKEHFYRQIFHISTNKPSVLKRIKWRIVRIENYIGLRMFPFLLG